MSAPILEVRDLCKCYGNAVALDHVTFQVAEGEMFGLLGPNGAGKTTLLSILSCLLAPSSGDVWIQGQKASLADTSLRRLIGIVPQELALYGELSARENLVFFAQLYGLANERLDRRVREVLAAVALEDQADRRVDTFSGGMKRRLNLGAALLHEPRILLLDEPTAGVDPQSRNHIFEEIRRVNRAGVTVVYTSHYMEEVQALCRRVGIIDHGKLIACDDLTELLKKLHGFIRFRVPEAAPELFDRLRQLPDIRLVDGNGEAIALECRDVKTTLPRLLVLLNELNLEILALEMEEPNLERVFLGLTGSALRD